MQLSSGPSITVGSRSLNCFRSRDWNKHFPQRCNRELLCEARTGIAYHDSEFLARGRGPPSTILSRFLTEVSNERTASDDPTASDRTDPAPAQHSELEPCPADFLSILAGIFGAVLSCHANHRQPVHRFRAFRSGHSLAAAPRDLLDRRPYFPRECAPV